jgi:hypothetical protein
MTQCVCKRPNAEEEEKEKEEEEEEEEEECRCNAVIMHAQNACVRVLYLLFHVAKKGIVCSAARKTRLLIKKSMIL